MPKRGNSSVLQMANARRVNRYPLYTCLLDYDDISLQRTKNVGALFVYEGIQKFCRININGLEEIEFGIENAILFIQAEV